MPNTDAGIRIGSNTWNRRLFSLPTLGLRSRIILLTCAISFLTATLMGMLAWQRSGEIALQTSQTAIRGETRIIAQRLMSAFANVGDDLVFVARSPAVMSLMRAAKNGGSDPRDGTPRHRIEDRVQRAFGAAIISNESIVSIEMIGLWGERISGMSRDGTILRMLKNTRVWDDTIPERVSTVRQMETGEVSLSFAEQSGQDISADFVTPIAHAGSTIAFLRVSVDLDMLVPPLIDSIPSPAIVYSLGESGDRHPPNFDVGDERHEGLNPNQDQGLPSGAVTLFGAFAASDASDRVFAASAEPPAWLLGPTLGIAVQVDRKRLIGPAIRARSETLLMASFLLMLSVAVSIAAARKLTNPLGGLTEMIASTSDVDGLADLPVSRSDEIGSLSRALNGLAQRLAYTESYAGAIVKSVEDAVITVDGSNRIVTTNPASRQLFPNAQPGCDLSDAIGDLPLEASGTSRERTLSFRHSTGDKDRHFDATISRLALRSRNMTTIVIRDVTAAREVEMFKEQLLGTVSHELRTPLTAIKAALLLLRHEMAGKESKLLDVALSNSQRLARLVDDILSMEKSRMGRLNYNLRRTNLAAFLGTFVDGLNALAAAHAVEFKLRIDAPHAMAEVDPNRLEQIMLNLVSNAAKFSPAGSLIVIALRVDTDQMVRIVVTDQGPGIPVDFRDKVFRPFASDTSTASHVQAGTGLGLSIARTMAIAMNGTITFDCHERGGTSFHVFLPSVCDPAVT